MPITKGFRALVDEAMAQIKNYSVEEVRARLADPRVQLVDIRDVRELAAGTVAGAYHAPRGMLEFWVDPESPYYKPVFAEGKTFIVYCQADWRGTLAAATLAEMGLPNVFHLQGGYGEWKKAGGPTGAREKKKS